MFLPPQPYMVERHDPHAVLIRIVGGEIHRRVAAARAAQVKFDPILDRVGGLDVEHDWAHTLSSGEQQLLAFARLLLANPRFAFLDQSVNALPPHRCKQLYQVLAATTISYLSVGDHVHFQEFHDSVLELHDNGSWAVKPIKTAKDRVMPSTGARSCYSTLPACPAGEAVRRLEACGLRSSPRPLPACPAGEAVRWLDGVVSLRTASPAGQAGRGRGECERRRC